MSENTQERLNFPITLRIEAHVTDGSQVGAATFVFGHGKAPTDGEIAEALEKVKGSLPEGFRLMNRAESVMHYMREERGYRGPNLVIPRTGRWHDPDADVDFTRLNDRPEDEDELEEF